MDVTETLWFKELNLNVADFSSLPEGSHPLIWGLQKGVVPEQALNVWASERFQIPRISPEFFHMAVDFTLVERFESLYSWNAHCYPVYFWEDTLFIACLTPENIDLGDQKHCLMAAPFTAMIQAWERHFAKEERTLVVPNEPPEDDSGSVEAEVAQKEGLPPAPESLGDLDFSGLDSLSPDAEPSSAEAPTPPPVPEATNTEVDAKALNQFTTATETVAIKKEASHLETKELPFPDTDFENISVDNISLDTEPDQSAPDIPPHPQQTAAPESSNEPPAPPEAQQAEEDFDDDYTPVPFISQEEKARLKHTSMETGQIKKPEVIEHTLTDHQSPSIPAEKLISDELMTSCLDLKDCKSTQHVVAHMFLHLKKDYRKLMWVESDKDGNYVPTYVYGHWTMEPSAWMEPVNLLQPNIFRIASVSGLPFHGEISDNPINLNYYKMWNAGKKPEAATIYPVSNGDELKGFVVGFSLNEDFDQVATLHKIENLIAICQKHLFGETKKKAA